MIFAHYRGKSHWLQVVPLVRDSQWLENVTKTINATNLLSPMLNSSNLFYQKQ